MEDADRIERILQSKPAQRSSDESKELVSLLSEQPFFAGTDGISLEQISTCMSLQLVPPGEVVLHAGEVSDRMYVVLRGAFTAVRQACKDGQQPQDFLLTPGQAFAEASLVVAGWRSDLLVTAADGGSGTGGALAVVSKSAWGTLCAKAPSVPECGAARVALLACCCRSLAAVPPAERTPQQCDDLAALLRHMPGLSQYPTAVLRVLSESAALRHLPASTIMYEEYTRADLQLLLLSGVVEARMRPKRYGEKRAALRSALRTAVAGKRSEPSRRNPGQAAGAADEGPAKSVRQKIEEERKAREEMKQSLALQREGLRSPSPERQREMQRQMTRARDVEAGFKKWMLEFMQRKRGGAGFADQDGINPDAAFATGPNASSGLRAGAGTSPTRAAAGRAAAAVQLSTRAPPAPKIANAWRRAAAKALEVEHAHENGNSHSQGTTASGEADPMLGEYERRKLEEQGKVKDVGQLLGGAGARSAYVRGLATQASDAYEERTAQGDGADQDGEHHGSVRWGGATAANGGHVSKADAGRHVGLHVDLGDDNDDGGLVDEDEGDDDPRVRLTYLNRRCHVVHKSMRFFEAMEKVLGVAKCSDDVDVDGGLPAKLNRRSSSTGDDADGGGGAAAAAGQRGVSLLYDRAVDDGGHDADGELTSREMDAAAAAATAAVDGGLPPYDDEVDDSEGEDPSPLHVEQLFGPMAGRLEAGQLVGELPTAALARGAQRPRRSHSAIAGPDAAGCDVLLLPLSALRRGHEAARREVAAERLRVLSALEPLRALSEEQLSQLALGAGLLCVDGGETVVRQGQPVDAMFVVMEGELRLVDDPDNIAAPPSITTLAAASAAHPINTSFTTASSSSSGGLGPDLTNTQHQQHQQSQHQQAGPGAAGADASGRQIQSVSCIKARRAAASLPTLLLLGPGGSFGEGVLGYPPPSDAGAAPPKPASTTPQSDAAMHPAGVVASRACKLLVFPRSLLLRFGPVRAALPPFAATRRDILAVRRAQTKAAGPPGMGNLPPPVPTTLSVVVPSSNGEGTAGGRTPLPGAAGLSIPSPLPSASTGAGSASVAGAGVVNVGGGSLGAGGGVVSPGAYRQPRPPPARPMDMLEQLGFPSVSQLKSVRVFSNGSNSTNSNNGAAANANAKQPSPSGGSFTSPASSPVLKPYPNPPSTQERLGQHILSRIEATATTPSASTSGPFAATSVAPSSSPALDRVRRATESHVGLLATHSSPTSSRPNSGGGQFAAAATPSAGPGPGPAPLLPPQHVRRTSLTGSWAPAAFSPTCSLPAVVGSGPSSPHVSVPRPYVTRVSYNGNGILHALSPSQSANLDSPTGHQGPGTVPLPVAGGPTGGAVQSVGSPTVGGKERAKRSSMPGCLPRPGGGAGLEGSTPSPPRARVPMPSFMGPGSQLLLPRIVGPGGSRNAGGGGGGGAGGGHAGRSDSLAQQEGAGGAVAGSGGSFSGVSVLRQGGSLTGPAGVGGVSAVAGLLAGVGSGGGAGTALPRAVRSHTVPVVGRLGD